MKPLAYHLAAVRKIRTRHEADVAARKEGAEHVHTTATVTRDEIRANGTPKTCRYTIVDAKGRERLSCSRCRNRIECCDTSEYRQDRATLLAAIDALLKEREP